MGRRRQAAETPATSGSKATRVPEPFQAAHEPPLDELAIAFIQVGAAQVDVLGPAGQQVPHDHQDRVPHCQGCFLPTFASCQPTILARSS
jgi:hypothetical protein